MAVPGEPNTVDDINLWNVMFRRLKIGPGWRGHLVLMGTYCADRAMASNLRSRDTLLHRAKASNVLSCTQFDLASQPDECTKLRDC